MNPWALQELPAVDHDPDKGKPKPWACWGQRVQAALSVSDTVTNFYWELFCAGTDPASGGHHEPSALTRGAIERYSSLCSLCRLCPPRLVGYLSSKTACACMLSDEANRSTVDPFKKQSLKSCFVQLMFTFCSNQPKDVKVIEIFLKESNK